MGISLEVKKFVNSEYVGQFAEIELPVSEDFRDDFRADKAQRPKDKARKSSKGFSRFTEDYQDDEQLEFDTEERPRRKYQDEGGLTERVRMHYLEEGNGEPLILIHSVGQSIFTWRNIFNRLSLNYRVIAVDLVGHGYSSRPEYFGYTIEEQARALELFMNAINIQSAHIMSFSMGCAYALQLALNCPERIGKMVLLAPGGISPEMPTPIKLLDSSLLGGVASMLYGVRTVEKVLADCFFDLTLLNADTVDEYYKTIADKVSRRAMRDSFHNFDDSNIVNRLRLLDAPVLMLQGAEDKWRTVEQAEIYHAAMPYAGYATIRNAGHLLHEEKQERIIAAILEYIPAIQIDI